MENGALIKELEKRSGIKVVQLEESPVSHCDEKDKKAIQQILGKWLQRSQGGMEKARRMKKERQNRLHTLQIQ